MCSTPTALKYKAWTQLTAEFHVLVVTTIRLRYLTGLLPESPRVRDSSCICLGVTDGCNLWITVLVIFTCSGLSWVRLSISSNVLVTSPSTRVLHVALRQLLLGLPSIIRQTPLTSILPVTGVLLTSRVSPRCQLNCPDSVWGTNLILSHVSIQSSTQSTHSLSTQFYLDGWNLSK